MLEDPLRRPDRRGRGHVPRLEAGSRIVVARDDLLRVGLEEGVAVPERRADVDVVEERRRGGPVGGVDDSVVDAEEPRARGRDDAPVRA